MHVIFLRILKINFKSHIRLQKKLKNNPTTHKTVRYDNYIIENKILFTIFPPWS